MCFVLEQCSRRHLCICLAELAQIPLLFLFVPLSWTSIGTEASGAMHAVTA